MALPAIAALIARLAAGRAGVSVLSELLASRAGTAAVTRGGAAVASKAEEVAVTEVAKRQIQYKTAEELLRRPKPQAPFGGVDVGGMFYKAGRFIPRAAVQEALQQSGGRIVDGPGGVMFSRSGAPPIQAPPVQAAGTPAGAPSEGQDASEPVNKLTTGVAKLLLVISPIAALGVVLSKMPATVERFGRSLLDAQMPLRRFSGTLNAVFAELERSDILRQKARADATTGSTATLAKAIDQLADDTKEVRHAAVSIFNLFAIALTHLARIVNWLIEKNPVISRVLSLIEKVEKWLGILNPVGGTWHAFVNDLSRGRYTGKHNQHNQKSGRP